MKVTIREAAEYLGVSMDTVRRRIKSGDIEAEKVFQGGVEIWLVTLPDRRTEIPPDPHPGPDRDQMVQILLAQLEETQRDRDRWYAMAMALGQRSQSAPAIALGTGQESQQPKTQEGIWRRFGRWLRGE